MKRLSLEKKVAHLQRNPIFFVYYVTAQGDVLGTLELRSMGIVFEPLNPRFKGNFTYQSGDLNDNCHAGFVLLYKDLIEPTRIIQLPSEETNSLEEDPLVFHLQIGLKHTGNYRHLDVEGQASVQLLSKNNTPLASVELKGRAASLDGKMWGNEERKNYVKLLQTRLSEIRSRLDDEDLELNSDWEETEDPDLEMLEDDIPIPLRKRVQSLSLKGQQTSIPFFDINFKGIFPGPAGLSYTAIQSQFEKLQKLFGYRCKLLEDISNESFASLKHLFPEVAAVRQKRLLLSAQTVTEVEVSTLDLMEKSKREQRKKEASKIFIWNPDSNSVSQFQGAEVDFAWKGSNSTQHPENPEFFPKSEILFKHSQLLVKRSCSDLSWISVCRPY